MTGLVEGVASHVLFNIISGRGRVKGRVCLPIPLFFPRGKGCRVRSTYIDLLYRGVGCY
jgi:hypothetical protein